MNKICPLLMIGIKRHEVLLHEGLASGNFMCIGDLCSAYRETRNKAYQPGNKDSVKRWCGLAGNEEHIHYEEV